MIRTKRSPLKSIGEGDNQIESKTENIDAFNSLSTKKLSSSSISSSSLQSVNRATPLIEIEDKENADPIFSISGADDSDHDDTVLDDYGDGMDLDLGCRDVSVNSDGFDISEEFQLDEPDLDCTKKSTHNSSDTEDEPSPFLMSSLLSNRMFALDKTTSIKLMSGEEGCSPALEPVANFNSLGLSTPGPSGSFKFRRSMSMVERPMILSSPELLKPISSIADFTSPVSRTGFKRPVPPTTDDPSQSKKCKTSESTMTSSFGLGLKRQQGLGVLRPSKSTSMLLSSPLIANIMNACSLSDKSNLTSDGISKLSLPTIQGATKNHDLNNIDCHVMAQLLNGEFNDQVASFRIIDARYSYEFKGGHIRGAENFGTWDEQSFIDEFFSKILGPKKLSLASDNNDEAKPEKRNILIFHCEFSSARGPALARMLRKKDREVNNDTYPALHYPECYLLHDGYKTFYANYPDLCEPKFYIPMADPKYISEERKFHKKSRTWAAGGGGTVARTGASSRLLKL